MNDTSKKNALLKDMAKALRCDIEIVECMRHISNEKLAALLEAMQSATNGTKREDRISDRRK